MNSKKPKTKIILLLFKKILPWLLLLQLLLPLLVRSETASKSSPNHLSNPTTARVFSSINYLILKKLRITHNLLLIQTTKTLETLIFFLLQVRSITKPNIILKNFLYSQLSLQHLPNQFKMFCFLISKWADNNQAWKLKNPSIF